jgi:hypothetical protein
VTLTLAVGHGTLTLGSTSDRTVTGNGSGSVTLTGSTADLNAEHKRGQRLFRMEKYAVPFCAFVRRSAEAMQEP